MVGCSARCPRADTGWKDEIRGRRGKRRMDRRRGKGQRYGHGNRLSLGGCVLGMLTPVRTSVCEWTVEAFVRAYLEPPTGATVNGVPVPPTLGAAATLTAAGGDDEVIPLPKGTLTDNIGLGLVIVCTKVSQKHFGRLDHFGSWLTALSLGVLGSKADHINVLERDATFTEEQFDYIQQALRTICLRCRSRPVFLFFQVDVSLTAVVNICRRSRSLFHITLTSDDLPKTPILHPPPTIHATFLVPRLSFGSSSDVARQCRSGDSTERQRRDISHRFRIPTEPRLVIGRAFDIHISVFHVPLQGQCGG